ncbi:tRNA pseudouridine synthase D TruD [Thermodesulfatator indicus DSM 15286]|uniref:tRNA pseudouridine synthase D TruD n=1 Tax=Thermodesulfatator indicus (strain DSM 15286 / JCM 11887 / CIR29812) TaxID=667014 RepID=F8A924_THEID|nr:tRNA pseudouridine(13) synthase TruD [Thermodesulfatator indicus]AEH45152.1 tRNA pseudouridine synthase D TruD [Thermodesulfatator indicus DSM 15286]
MRIKVKPEDFIVYEVADIRPEPQGDFALYRLYKRGATTWDVIGDIARRLRLKASAIQFGGLKDRHAISYQYVTIRHGPKKDIKGKNYELSYLGQTKTPMSKARLKGNFFRLLVREVKISPEKLSREIALISRYGVVNYFDEQRFGSVKHGLGFAVKELILGHYERALYLLLAEGSQYEMKRTEAFRKCLKKNWPNFSACLDLAPSPWERRLLEFLASHKPSKRTFKRAFALVDREYLLMLCHAYQAYIWNETVKLYLKNLGLKLLPVPYLLGELLFYRDFPEELTEAILGTKIPLPSPRLILDQPLKELMEEVLRLEGIDGLEKFRTLAKGATFKTYPREVAIIPQKLKYETVDQNKVWLEFFLPKGSYATIVLKRLFLLPETN